MPLNPDLTLQEHQRRVREQAAAAAAQGTPYRKLLVWGTGSGKGIGALGAADALGGTTAAVAPAAVRPTLQQESLRALGHQIPVVSYHGAASGKLPSNDTLVLDEAQRLGSPTSTQAQAVREQAEKAKNLILLSATPVRNNPAEFAPLLSALTGKQISHDEFKERFVGTEKVRPGVLGRLFGAETVERPALVHTDELKELLGDKVDYYKAETPPVDVTHETHEAELTPRQADLYSAMYGKLPWILRYKLRWNYPLTDAELVRARSFLTGPRQVALSDLPFRPDGDPIKAFENSGKLQLAHKLLSKTLSDPRRKAIVYSNFVDAGLRPYAAALAKNKIPHGVFHGGLSDPERKQMVNDFNANKLRVALVAPAGAEGISLKGSQLLQLLDPHYNEARTTQAQARGIRFDSHTHLPEDLKGITVQKFVARLPLGLRGRLLASVGVDQEGRRKTVDDYLQSLSARKEELNDQLMTVLKQVAAADRSARLAIKTSVDLAVLKDIKRRSDSGDYFGKAAVLRDLIRQSPNEWHVDSDQGYTVGLSHAGTGFRYHLPKHLVADLPLRGLMP